MPEEKAEAKPPPIRKKPRRSDLKMYLIMMTPDRVLDIAYNLYVLFSADESKNEVERQSEIYLIAKNTITKFRRVCETHNSLETPEGRFLFAIEQMVVSLARGINRRKNVCKDRLLAAREKKERQIKELSGGTFKIGFLKACWRAVFLGGLGFYLARRFLPDLHLGENKSPTYASLAVAIGAVLLGQFVKSLWVSFRINRIFNSYENAKMRAENAYNKGVMEEYGRAKRDAARCWRQYTGRDPEQWLGFDAILAEDMKQNGEAPEPKKIWHNIALGASAMVRRIKMFQRAKKD